MSSRYRLICMSHDPAITIGEDLVVETAIRSFRTGDERIADHEKCDIMVGEYSYPLVTIGCFGQGMPNTTCYNGHLGIIWHDVDWLKALATSIGDHEDFDAIAGPRGNGCLTRQRISRLYPMLKREG